MLMNFEWLFSYGVALTKGQTVATLYHQ